MRSLRTIQVVTTVFLLSMLLSVLLSTACTVTIGKADPASQQTIGAKAVTPTATVKLATATPKPEPNIVVTAPVAGQVVRSPVRVSGIASVFEGTVSIAVKDASGKAIGKSNVQASEGAPGRGTFSTDLSFTQPITAQTGTVEVYAVSPKDGSTIDLVGIKVNIAGR